MGRSENFLGVHPVRFVDDIYNFVTVVSPPSPPTLGTHCEVASTANHARDVWGAVLRRKRSRTVPVTVTTTTLPNQYIKRSVDMLERALMDDPETKGSSIEVSHGCVGCQSRLVASLDKNVDKFELYVVRNCLRVPAHLDDSSALAIGTC